MAPCRVDASSQNNPASMPLEPPQIHPIAEDDLDAVIIAAGGQRAHPDADRRSSVGADYLLGDALVELKLLDEDGLDKPERRHKLAQLFRQHSTDSRPVIVLDPHELPASALRDYKEIIRGPIKAGVATAKKQLKQSRIEYPETTCSVLLVINNSYAALTHDEVLALVADRARNDTTQIDVVVAAGCYFHSDGFDSYFLWPMDQIVIHADKPFTGYNALLAAWQDFSEKFMTAVVRGRAPTGKRMPVRDSTFVIDGVTYVKPAPPIGGASQFFGVERPRIDSSGLDACPPVATTFPELSVAEWRSLRRVLADPHDVFQSYGAWQALRSRAAASHHVLRPFVAMPVSRGSFESWRRRQKAAFSVGMLMAHANDCFDRAARRLIENAHEYRSDARAARLFILVATEVIGQDRANDVSHLALVEVGYGKEPQVEAIASDLRIFHEHALALGAAYALRHGVPALYWQKDLRHAWH